MLALADKLETLAGMFGIGQLPTGDKDPFALRRAALGVINLGNVEHVKTLMPEAVTVLIDASLDTIRQRLIARGVNTEEQIAERLGNAARVEQYRRFYDVVVSNPYGSVTSAVATLTVNYPPTISGQRRISADWPNPCLATSGSIWRKA